MGVRSLLAGAVAFQAKHPVLRGVTVVLLVLPAYIDHLVRRGMAAGSPTLLSDGPLWQQPLLLGTLLVLLLTTIVELWGVSCVLVAARRLLGHPAGRSRRVLRSLMREGAHYVPTIFLTSVLRVCTVTMLLLPSVLLTVFLLLWHGARPLAVLPVAAVAAVPAVLYALKSALYAVTIVGEGTGYRAALRRSADAFRGRLLPVATRVLLLLAITMGPAVVLEELLALRIPAEELSARTLVADAVVSAAEGTGTLLSTVAFTLLYANLRSHAAYRTAPVARKKSAKRPRA